MSDTRILYINSSAGWGGMEMHPIVVADALAGRGHEVTFAMQRASPVQRCMGQRRFAPVALHFPWYMDPASFRRLSNMVRAQGINVIHVHFAKDTWRALLLAGIMQKRAVLVFTKHMGSPSSRRKKDPLHRLLVKRIDAVIAISSYIRGNVLKTSTIDQSKVHVIHYGVGAEAVGSPEKGREVRSKLGILPDEPVVGLVAQLCPGKRQELFLEAAQRVAKVFPACRFVLVGSSARDEYQRKLFSLVKALGIEENVRFLGFLENIPPLMQALDVLVLPSKEEAFGLVLLEAMANSRAVVASDSGALPEIVSHGVNGLLFEPGNPDALARSIADLVRSPEKRLEMGEAGQRMIRDRFMLDREVSETEILYQRLLSGR